MKKQLAVCQHCGNEWQVTYYTAEEARRYRIRTIPGPPPCPKCGSHHVRLYR